jgi:hypothetical protein
MKANFDLSETMLGEQQQTAVQLFCKSITAVPNNTLKSIILYGSAARKDYRSGLSDINLLIILEHADIMALKSIIEPVTIGRSERIAPLFLSTADLLKVAEAFPLKFLSIRESHKLLYGNNPFAEIEICKEALHRRCQQEMVNLLMRLRRHYLNSMGHNLAGFLVTSFKGFSESLRIFLYLTNNNLPSRDETVGIATTILGANMDVVHEIIKIKDSQEVPDNDIVQAIYDRYFRLIEQIVYKM